MAEHRPAPNMVHRTFRPVALVFTVVLLLATLLVFPPNANASSLGPTRWHTPYGYATGMRVYYSIPDTGDSGSFILRHSTYTIMTTLNSTIYFTIYKPSSENFWIREGSNVWDPWNNSNGGHYINSCTAYTWHRFIGGFGGYGMATVYGHWGHNAPGVCSRTISTSAQVYDTSEGNPAGKPNVRVHFSNGRSAWTNYYGRATVSETWWVYNPRPYIYATGITLPGTYHYDPHYGYSSNGPYYIRRPSSITMSIDGFNGGPPGACFTESTVGNNGCTNTTGHVNLDVDRYYGSAVTITATNEPPGYNDPDRIYDRSLACLSPGGHPLTASGTWPTFTVQLDGAGQTRCGLFITANPTPPVGVTATRTNKGWDVTVTWNPPTSNGGINVTQYVITGDSNNSQPATHLTDTVDGATFETVFEHLLPGDYIFTVTAINTVAPSDPAGDTNTVTLEMYIATNSPIWSTTLEQTHP